MLEFLKKKKQKQGLSEFIQKLESDDCDITIPPSSTFESVANAAINEGVSVDEYMKTHNVNSFGETLDKLVDGDLPWGWVTAQKSFINRIEKEFDRYWSAWIAARNTPINEHNTLKALLQYMHNLQLRCDKKGECFGFWCRNYLIGEQKERCEKRLAELEANMDTYLHEYEERQKFEAFEASLTDEMILDAITQHEGMLQKDLCKLFPYPKAISSKLYYMEKEGKIERIKSGNSYILKISQ